MCFAICVVALWHMQSTFLIKLAYRIYGDVRLFVPLKFKVKV